MKPQVSTLAVLRFEIESTYNVALGMANDEHLASLRLRSEKLNTSGDVFCIHLGISQTATWYLDVTHVVLGSKELLVSSFPIGI